MNRARLATLAAHLETVPRHLFNMNSWCDLGGAKISNGAIPKPTCNTRACAAGWACSIPELNKAGLKLRRQWDYIEPEFENHRATSALMLFFGIDQHIAQRIFMPHRDLRAYDDPVAVSKVIYELLAK